VMSECLGNQERRSDEYKEKFSAGSHGIWIPWFSN
jgi:hypothetical protein